MSKWISVKDRLPEKGAKLLLYVPKTEKGRQSGIFTGELKEVKANNGSGNFWEWFPKHWDALCKKGREMWRIDLPSESTNADMIAKLGEQRLAMWLCERLICSKCLEMQGAEKCEGVEGLEKWLRTRVGETP